VPLALAHAGMAARGAIVRIEIPRCAAQPFGATYPCLYMTVLVSDGPASDKRGGALMVLRSNLACVAEIAGGRGGLPGFLVGG
jgi:hypothetical protein